MGTNYYRMKTISKEDREKLHKKLDEVLDVRGGDYILTEELEEIKNKSEVHICKSSCGWQVNFDHNWGKYYQPNRKSLEAFLSEPNTWIEDEYAEKISYDDFWKFVKEHNEHPRNRWTSKSYREESGYDDSCYCKKDILRCKELFGIDAGKETDFEVDGLRFAVFSNFS
jgi:hypothetical protein|nr:MAG TPA: hypothetical protein [Caudoviricetes sp.]